MSDADIGALRFPQITDPQLAEIARGMEQTGWACELLDASWRVVWISAEMRRIFGADSDEELGCGETLFAAWTRAQRNGALTEESMREARSVLAPYAMAAGRGSELDTHELGPELVAELSALEPRPAPPVWSWSVAFRAPGAERSATINCLGFQLRDHTGDVIGNALVYGSGLPATLLALLTRGDERMFRRMGELTTPAPRESAILFTDLQSSTNLSRRLSSAAFFRLVREMTSRIDRVLVDHGGLVGKHAGDGATGFFLAEHHDGASGCVRAAIGAARELAAASDDVAAAVEGVEPSDVPLNVAVHWGGPLWIGQVVTDGRLEITALGDEVNQCARIQAAARDGEALASKRLIERLDPADAAALSLEPHALRYRMVADLPGAPEKTVRDAGTIPVTRL